MEEKKISFFKRVKIAIFNLEDYKTFANEKFSKALRYIFSLIAIITLILSISTTVFFKQKFDKLVSYVKNDFPDFSFEDGNLTVADAVNSYDEEYEAKLIVNTSEEVSDEQIENYKEEAEDGYYSLILFKNKAIYKLGGYEYEATYSDFFNTLGISNFTKAELFENYLNEDGMVKITFVIFIYAVIYLFISNILVIIEDILIIAIFGWICSRICKVALDFGKNCTLAIYSVTLPLILSTIYSIVSSFTNFEIKYFSLMYMIIAYIYIIAAIMIIRSDPNKKVGQEVPVNDEKKDDVIEVEKVEEENKEKNKDKDDEQKENNHAVEEKKTKRKKKEAKGDTIPDGE